MRQRVIAFTNPVHEIRKAENINVPSLKLNGTAMQP
jgi:hypothetical protein